jgi:hypothetical protein
MTMRRLPVLILIAALGGAMLSIVTLSTLMGAGRHAMGSASQRALGLCALAAAPAQAEEVMEFKPVPAESVADVLRPRSRRSTAVPAPPASPGSPSLPAAPSPPPAPSADGDVNLHLGDKDDVGRSGDIVRFGSNIHVGAGQTIAGDVVAMGGDVTVDGHVEGDVVAMGGDVSLGPAGKVDGEVVTLGGQLHEQPGSYVGGQRVTAGGLPRGWAGWPFLGVLGMVGSGIKAALVIAMMVLALLVAWAFTQLAPNRTRMAYDAVKREPLMCFGIGLLAWALVIPSVVALALVFAILCITIIGIPLALAVLLGYVLVLILLVIWGYVVGAAVLGERLARQFGRTASSLTMMAVWGIVALTIIRVVGHLFGGIPMGGFPGGMLVLLSKVIGCIVMTIGAGALLRTQARREVIGQWWSGRRGAAAYGTAGGPAPAAPASVPAPPMPVVDPPPASPPPPAI